MTTETEGPLEASEASGGRLTLFYTLFDRIAFTPLRDLSARLKAMDPNNCEDLLDLILQTALFTAVLLPVVMIGFLYILGLGNLLTGNGLNILLGAIGLHAVYCISSPFVKFGWNALHS